ncbi:MAG: hydantoinase B/oxoprolinase family protein, partial [Alphaproteobacteria bacterium]
MRSDSNVPAAGGTSGAAELSQMILEVIKNATYHILEEATVRIMRSGYSTIMKESRDISVSLHDLSGDIVAQPNVQPVHLGNLQAQVKGVIKRYAAVVRPGDSYIVNHPYEECQNHASDITLISPVFHNGELVAWSGNTAHKPDIGGKVPGSNAGDATDTIQEGLLIPPVRVMSNYETLDHSVWEIVRANTRVPDLTLGDIRAQIGANFVIEQKINDLLNKYGKAKVIDCWSEWIRICDATLRERIRSMFPEGEFVAEDFMDDDGINLDQPYRMSVRVARRGDELHFHLDSDPQASGPINFRPCMTAAAAYFCVKAIFARDLPNNVGLQHPIRLHFPPVGSLINPAYLAPVNMYSMSSLRMADVLLRALAKALPDRVPASSSGYIAGISLSGRHELGRPWVHYEIYVGGTGGRPGSDGMSGMDANVTNTMNAPAEAVEVEFPIRVERYELIRDSAGAGTFRGGLGIRRDYRVLADRAVLSLRSDRNKFPPQGLLGGGNGSLASCTMDPESKQRRALHSKATGIHIPRDGVVRFQTPGGGGRGDPLA